MFTQNALTARALRIQSRTAYALSAAAMLFACCGSQLSFAQTRSASLAVDDVRCEVAEAAIPFGRIDMLQRSTWRAQGYLRIRCERADASSARSTTLIISLVPGPRALSRSGQGSQEFAYDLFSDSNFSLPWGADAVTTNSLERRFDWGVGLKNRLIEIPIFAIARPDKITAAGEYFGAMTLSVAVR